MAFTCNSLFHRHQNQMYLHYLFSAVMFLYIMDINMRAGISTTEKHRVRDT